MLRKSVKIFILFTFIFSSSAFYNQAQAQMNPKLKAFLICSGYGAALGGLLGVASLAFDAKERAVAQGASLGLYAGIIFGIYVINSYGKGQPPEPGTYQDGVTPYQGDNIPPPDDPYSDESAGGGGLFDEPGPGGGFRIQSINHNEDFSQFETKSHPNSIPLYLELARFSF